MCDPSVCGEREGVSQAGRNQKALCSLRQTTQTWQAAETEGAEEAGEVEEVREGGAAAAEKEAGKGERNFPQKQSHEKPANNFFLLPVAAYWPQLARLVLVVVVRS